MFEHEVIRIPSFIFLSKCGYTCCFIFWFLSWGKVYRMETLNIWEGTKRLCLTKVERKKEKDNETFVD